MVRVLVTGGAGFIGSHLVDHLIAIGKDVTVLDDFSAGLRANLTDGENSRRLRVVEGSVLSETDIRRAMEGCEAVFHLAVKSVRHSIGQPLDNHAVNAGGTLNVLEAARRAGLNKFVYCSSSEVYGNAFDTRMREKTTVCKPATVYGGSKLAGEHYTAAYHETYGLPTVILRPFNAYGPRSHLHGKSGEVIPRFFARILNGQRPVIFGDGKQTRDFTFVMDTARAIALAAGAEAAVGKVINIAAGKAVSILDLAQTIAFLCGRPDLTPEFHAARPGDVRALWANTEVCQALLRFQPSAGLQDGLRRYLAWFKDTASMHDAAVADAPLHNWASA